MSRAFNRCDHRIGHSFATVDISRIAPIALNVIGFKEEEKIIVLEVQVDLKLKALFVITFKNRVQKRWISHGHHAATGCGRCG